MQDELEQSSNEGGDSRDNEEMYDLEGETGGVPVSEIDFFELKDNITKLESLVESKEIETGELQIELCNLEDRYTDCLQETTQLLTVYKKLRH